MRAERGFIVLDTPDPKLEAELDRQFKRQPGTLRWFVPSGAMTRVLSFLRTIASGRTSEQVAAERLAICVQCPGMKIINGRKHCGVCMCSGNLLAELDGGPAPKLRWADARCPLQRF